MLELGVTFSMEQLVIDNDIISMIKKAMDGIPVNEYTLAVDAIKEVGVGNDFIGHETTMDNMDLPSDPLVINRDMIGDWRAAGCKNLAEAAHDVVEDVLKNHTVEPLTPEVDAAMKAIVKKADDEFLGSRREARPRPGHQRRFHRRNPGGRRALRGQEAVPAPHHGSRQRDERRCRHPDPRDREAPDSTSSTSEGTSP